MIIILSEEGFIDSRKSTSTENHSGDSDSYMMVPAALLSLALSYHETGILSASTLSSILYNDVYVDDHFQMEMVVNVKSHGLCRRRPG